MREPLLAGQPNTPPQFCGPIPTDFFNIPLRVKKRLAPSLLADSEFKQVPTEELIMLARSRKHVYVIDRASAIAALKGTSNL